MATDALQQSIREIIGIGPKLSITIFDFAATLGSGGSQLQSIATEVTLFCSIVRQLQTVLSSDGVIFSSIASATVQDIIGCCKEIFEGIENITNDLCSHRGLDFIPSVEFVNRARWTLQKAKVKVLESTLKSCKITLHIIIASFEMAGKFSTRKRSSAATTYDDEQDKVFIQSLILSQQCSVLHLAHLEDLSEREEDLAEWRVGQQSHNGVISKNDRHQQHFLSSTFHNDTAENSSPIQQHSKSAWLSNLICADDPSSEPHPGLLQKRLSCAGTDHQALQLMRKWTMLEVQHRHQPNGGSGTETSPSRSWKRYSFSYAGQREPWSSKDDSESRDDDISPLRLTCDPISPHNVQTP